MVTEVLLLNRNKCEVKFQRDSYNSGIRKSYMHKEKRASMIGEKEFLIARLLSPDRSYFSPLMEKFLESTFFRLRAIVSTI